MWWASRGLTSGVWVCDGGSPNPFFVALNHLPVSMDQGLFVSRAQRTESKGCRRWSCIIPLSDHIQASPIDRRCHVHHRDEMPVSVK